MAVQTIKSQSKGPWDGKAHHSDTWYEPFTAQADIDRAVGWVLSRPGIFLNTPGDLTLAAQSAGRGQPLLCRRCARAQ